MKLDQQRALHDLRRMLQDTLHDQLRQRRDAADDAGWFRGCRDHAHDETWYACVGLARECIASLRLLDHLTQ